MKHSTIDKTNEATMCDELTVKDDEEYLRKHDLTRRDFNKGAAGVALSMMLPSVANAMDVVEEEV